MEISSVLFIEDDLRQRNYLVEKARRYNPLLDIHCADKVSVAMDRAMNNNISAFFVDIILPDGSGIDFAKRIRMMEQYKFTPIVFITGEISKELEAFREIHCYDFIMKPYNEETIGKTLQKILVDYFKDNEKEKENKYLDLEFKGIKQRINIKDIIFLERRNRKIHIKTRFEEIMYKQMSLWKILKLLPDQFMQVHQSIIVNTDYLEKIDLKANELHLQNIRDVLPVGISFRKKVGESINDIL